MIHINMNNDTQQAINRGIDHDCDLSRDDGCSICDRMNEVHSKQTEIIIDAVSVENKEEITEKQIKAICWMLLEEGYNGDEKWFKKNLTKSMAIPIIGLLNKGKTQQALIQLNHLGANIWKKEKMAGI